MDFVTVMGLLARHGLTSLAGVLVAHGLIASSQTEQFASAGLFLLGIGWSIYQKYGQAKVRAFLAGKGVKAVIFAGLALLAAAAIEEARATDVARPALPFPIPTKAIQTALTGTYDWSGFYLAVGLGGAATKGHVDLYTLPESSNINPAGIMVGGKVGARKQFGNLVAGLEVGGFWNNERGSVTIGSQQARLGNSWFGHVTPHLGLTASQAIANVGALNGKLTNPLKLASVTAPQPSVLFWIGPDLALRDAKIDLSDNTHADVTRIGYGVRGGVDIPVSNLFFGIEAGWDKFNKFDCIPGYTCLTGLQVKFREWEGLARVGMRF